MDNPLLNKEVQKFIFNYEGDSTKLAFSGSPFSEISTKQLITQIESRKKAEKKLPIWHSTEGILYPPKLNLEQTSSQVTAAYKSRLVTGETLADFTGGYGVDCLFFSKVFKTVTHFEINESLSQIVNHNYKKLKKHNIKCITGNAFDHLQSLKFDVVYIDPSRRHDTKGKVFFLKDCLPNIPKNLNVLFQHTDTILIKTSPMLDISVGLSELDFVKEIHIVAVENEVKELLWLINKKTFEALKIKTINISDKGNETFSFLWEDKKDNTYTFPKKYLYEPNAAIMKSGAFNLLPSRFKVEKLEKHTHLYTSEELQIFPGRSFKIKQIINYNKKEMRNGITFDKANITTRNFPESVATLRKKWKLKDGGNHYLFFTTVAKNQKILLICAKI
ncbi:hypothetical protein ULMS_18140 [Patiriisocius marinistellae]|uniref:Uncharacterized protein n=1 Tax=Patiriisocius marinistellae TaxID=2494560 RepID=A0A5J4G1B5_9FLAO|nr:class I SAM-dependent methyltransferase [Patiriisocius marinistellae]GEQ86306.1 hypothetical protein ULMS_18140 [Patiriisocius marinistellae]